MKDSMQISDSTICIFMTTWRNKERNSMEKNVTEHSISSKGFLYYYSTIISIKGIVFKTNSSLLKDEIDVIAFLK